MKRLAEALRRLPSEIRERLRARIALGVVEHYQEDAPGVRWLEDLAKDARYAARTLWKRRTFTAAAVLTLTLGIGASAAVFSIVDGVWLRPLPYEEPAELYTLWEATARSEPRFASYPTFRDWREQSDRFSGLAYIRGDDITMRAERGTQRLLAAYVSDGFFRTLGVRTALGRGFAGVESGAGGSPVVLSHRLWRTRFGGDPDVLGRTLPGREASYTIVGVMPRASYPAWADVWVPMNTLPASDPVFTRRDLHVDSDVIARLGDGVTLAQAREQMDAIAARLAAAHPDDAAEYTRVAFNSLRERLLGDDVGRRLLVLAAAVAVVLLIACVNVAGLLLARATARGRELAVRAALGAGRGRLVRQLLTEALLLALAAGAAGVLLATLAVEIFSATAPGALPRLDEVAVDGGVLLFALAVSVGTALLFAALPALRATAPDPAPTLRAGTAGTADAERKSVRLRGALVAAQVALTFVLVVGAGLLIRSLWELHRERLGFDPDPVAAVRIFPPSPRYDDANAAAELYRRLEEAAASVPGVETAAVTNHVPLAGAWMPTRVSVPGREPSPDGRPVVYRTISPDYFGVLQTPVRRGRSFVEADLNGAGVAIVNETFARTYLDGGDPIGQAVTVTKAAQGRPDFGEPIAAQVVGVVGDVRELGPDSPPPPVVYVPYTANPWGNTYLIARAASDPRSLIPALRRAVLDVDPDLPVTGPSFFTQFHVMREYLGRRLRDRNLQTRLLAGFAAVALVLALVGLFGVLSYVVARRTREIGVRVALGASRTKVLGLVVGRAMRIFAVGVVLGALGALAATRALRSSLYGVSAADPLTFIAAALLFAAAALAASYLPARRAARIDPVRALNAE